MVVVVLYTLLHTLSILYTYIYIQYVYIRVYTYTIYIYSNVMAFGFVVIGQWRETGSEWDGERWDGIT